MKLFMFYPYEFCRMYVIGLSEEDVLSRSEELFQAYMSSEYSWYDKDDDEYIQEKRVDFIEGIAKIKEMTDGFAIDSHY